MKTIIIGILMYFLGSLLPIQEVASIVWKYFKVILVSIGMILVLPFSIPYKMGLIHAKLDSVLVFDMDEDEDTEDDLKLSQGLLITWEHWYMKPTAFALGGIAYLTEVILGYKRGRPHWAVEGKQITVGYNRDYAKKLLEQMRSR